MKRMKCHPKWVDDKPYTDHLFLVLFVLFPVSDFLTIQIQV